MRAIEIALAAGVSYLLLAILLRQVVRATAAKSSRLYALNSKFSPAAIRVGVVVNSLMLGAALIGYKMGYIDVRGLGRQGSSPSKLAALAADTDDGAMTGGSLLEVHPGDMMVSTKSAPAIDSSNSDRLDFHSGLTPVETGSSVLALDVDADDPSPRASASPATQP